jgi:hypothetical protein
MNNPTSIGEQAKRRIGAAGKGGAMVRRVSGKIMCVLALVLLSLTVGAGVRSDRDISTAEARFAPTGIVAPTTATLSPDPNADGGNENVAQVTSRARFKAH